MVCDIALPAGFRLPPPSRRVTLGHRSLIRKKHGDSRSFPVWPRIPNLLTSTFSWRRWNWWNFVGLPSKSLFYAFTIKDGIQVYYEKWWLSNETWWVSHQIGLLWTNTRGVTRKKRLIWDPQTRICRYCRIWLITQQTELKMSTKVK